MWQVAVTSFCALQPSTIGSRMGGCPPAAPHQCEKTHVDCYATPNSICSMFPRWDSMSFREDGPCTLALTHAPTRAQLQRHFHPDLVRVDIPSSARLVFIGLRQEARDHGRSWVHIACGHEMKSSCARSRSTGPATSSAEPETTSFCTQLPATRKSRDNAW